MSIASLPAPMAELRGSVAPPSSAGRLSFASRPTDSGRQSACGVVVLVSGSQDDEVDLAKTLRQRGYRLQPARGTGSAGNTAVRDLHSVLTEWLAEVEGVTVSVIDDVQSALPAEGEDITQIEELLINRSRREVWLAGVSVVLTKSEFDVLHLLASRPGIVFSREEIVVACKGDRYPVAMRSVDVMVVSLRRKLGPFGKRIQTMRGVGYRFF